MGRASAYRCTAILGLGDPPNKLCWPARASLTLRGMELGLSACACCLSRALASCPTPPPCRPFRASSTICAPIGCASPFSSIACPFLPPSPLPFTWQPGELSRLSTSTLFSPTDLDMPQDWNCPLPFAFGTRRLRPSLFHQNLAPPPRFRSGSPSPLAEDSACARGKGWADT